MFLLVKTCTVSILDASRMIPMFVITHLFALRDAVAGIVWLLDLVRYCSLWAERIDGSQRASEWVCRERVEVAICVW